MNLKRSSLDDRINGGRVNDSGINDSRVSNGLIYDDRAQNGQFKRCTNLKNKNGGFRAIVRLQRLERR